ncbi:hypothetical protein [uncultured Methanospirillum sp.]|uniref:hypothetical protein n=1 Tax=uncultured Methanospirillum sp. TaxID=262503 RepID=UPI0029C733F6|nr:hypothetical protein [uncultured Methanospirillum sp.]
MIGNSILLWVRTLFLILLIANGLIFVASLPAVIDPALALQIHSDLYPECGILMITLKSAICFGAGVAYLVAAYGCYRRSSLVLAGVVGAVPFFLLYLIELILWGSIYPHVWTGFLIFGLASLIIMTGSWFSMRTTVS